MSAPLLRPDAGGLARAAGLLRRGEVIGFPTDTVYGLAALASDVAACDRIYEVKRRPAEKALIAMAPEVESFEPLVELTPAARMLARRWWPGPLTLVLPALGGQEPTLGVRVPDHELALALLREVGSPLATTSANLSGAAPAMTPQEAARLEGVAAVLDGGPAPGGVPSTVLTLAAEDPEVLRAGPISRQALLLPLLAERFRRFAEAEAAGSSPLYEAISAGVAERPEVLELLLRAQPGQRRPNLLLAAAQALLLEGLDHPLRRWYPDLGGTLMPSPAAAEAFADLVLSHADRVRAIVATRRTQTNEVLRSASLALALARVPGPVALIDAGCSAGLNLLLDRYRYDYGLGSLGPSDAPLTLRCELRGAGAAVPGALPRVVWRAGLDAAPLDPGDPETARWLEALVWPEHRDRRERLVAALRLAAAEPVPLRRGDVLEDLAGLAQEAPGDATLVVQHS
ncbi:MAG: threonylcarbamoyl-AMP synthase, partial [Candidatus Dormibacteraeota bacterium]|nr:threonylcarbamoyl-AMP synthase [Candidatus Dormibacteraeota bacterium]